LVRINSRKARIKTPGVTMVRFKTNEGRTGRLRKTDLAVGDIFSNPND
jgi:hypothetical protein